MNESVVEVQGVGGDDVCSRRKDKSVTGCCRFRLLGLGLLLMMSHDDGGGPCGVFFGGTEWVLKGEEELNLVWSR